MIEFVGFYPPASNFHQRERFGVLVCEKRVKRNPDYCTFGFDFVIADRNDSVSHGVSEVGIAHGRSLHSYQCRPTADHVFEFHLEK
jgi:hypothetical protein